MNGLTSRQQQIADLIGAGKRSKEIARICGVRGSTIDNHSKIIATKLGLGSLTDLRNFLQRSMVVGAVFNANEGTGNRPIWLPVPEGFQLNQPVYDVVRRVE